MGAYPKDPAMRQRRNKVPGAATLSMVPKRKRAPSLPKRADGQEWHALAVRWWRSVFRSPMAAEYLEADVEGLCRVVMLVDRFWKKPSITMESQILREQALYGLTPMDRRRLSWVIEKDEEAKKHRYAPTTPMPSGLDDPRQYLQVVQ